MRVGPADEPVRVEFSDAMLAAALAARCPDLNRRKESGGTLRLVLWSVAAGLSVLLVALFGVPRIAGVLAPLVPVEAEARLGTVAEPQVLRFLGSPPPCTEAAGSGVLEGLVARLVAASGSSGALPPDLAVSVRRHGLANAFALPGARVIMLSNPVSYTHLTLPTKA